VVETIDGSIVAVGYSDSASFGSGNWTGITGKGGDDASVVKFCKDGNVVWNKNFGGTGSDYFRSLTTASDGSLVVVGFSGSGSFGNGSWTGITGKGGDDASVVKFNSDGVIEWKNNFGGSSGDYFYSMTAAKDGNIVAVGNSDIGSFGNGSWAGITGKGGNDATIAKLENEVVGIAPSINSANNVSFTAGAGGSFTFTATGKPSPTWLLSGAPAGVSVNSGTGVLTVASSVGEGTYTLTVKAVNGTLPGATQSFKLTVTSTNIAPSITSANNASFTAGAGGSFTFTATGTPSPTWSLSGAPAGVSVNGATGVLTVASSVGDGKHTFTVKASNGTLPDTTQSFELTLESSDSDAGGGLNPIVIAVIAIIAIAAVAGAVWYFFIRKP
jgi:hypothetical protein